LRYTQSNRGNQHRSTPERERSRRAVRAVRPARAPTGTFPRLAPSQGRLPRGPARTEAPRGRHPPRAAPALAPYALPRYPRAGRLPRSGPPLARRDASPERTTTYKRGRRPPRARRPSPPTRAAPPLAPGRLPSRVALSLVPDATLPP
jgi:hypothetical protein